MAVQVVGRHLRLEAIGAVIADGAGRVRRWGNGPRGPSKQAALASALLMARVARLAWKASGRPSH